MSGTTVAQVLRKAFSENLTVMTGVNEQLGCARCPERQFVRWLLDSETGATVNIFSESEQYDAILVVPRAVLNALGSAYRGASVPHDQGAGDDPRETDHRVLTALQGNVGRLFGLKLNAESDDWTTQAQFSLPSDYGIAAMPELIWRSSDYVHYRVSSRYGEFFVLVFAAMDSTLTNRLQNSRRFRERAAEEIIHSYIGGGAEVYGEEDSAEIRVVDQAVFRLGGFLLARQYTIGEHPVATRFEALAVGPPQPESGISIRWALRFGDATHSFGIAFPELDERTSHVQLAKLIGRQTMRHLRATLEPLALVELSRARVQRKCEWDSELFLVKASVSIMGRRLSVWVYAPMEYIYQLQELLHGFVVWDVRKRSAFAMMLSLIAFNQNSLRNLLTENPRALLPDSWDGFPEEPDVGFMLGHLLGLASRHDRIAILQFFLIGQNGYGVEQIRSLFYYQDYNEAGMSPVRALSGFRDELVTDVMPRVAAQQFRQSRHASVSLEVLVENNEHLLADLYEAIARGRVEATARTRMLLHEQFLQPYNVRFCEKIQALVNAGEIPALLRSVPVAQAQNMLCATTTHELAQALLFDPDTSAIVARIIARTYWRDIEYAKATAHDDLEAGRLTLRSVHEAMRALMHEIRRVRDQKLLA